MKLSAAVSVIFDIKYGLEISAKPILREMWTNPSIFLNLREVPRIISAEMWKSGMGDGLDFHAQGVKKSLITPHASGVVLDIGAGHGHTAKYLNRQNVTKYIALEPNVRMHPKIRSTAADVGFHEDDGSLEILGCGAEHLSTIVRHLPPGSVNTIVCIQAMCSFPDIPSPQAVLRALVDAVLAPDGELLMYEHVLSLRADVAWWQRLWTPIWKRFLDGCRLDRPSLMWVEGMSCWKDTRVWVEDGEPEERLFWHQIGRFVKK